MYHKDYILRMIEMVGQLIAAILGKIKGGDHDKASELLSNLYYDVLREDAAYFRTLTADDMTKKLLEEHNYTNGHLEILAELFNAEAELSMAKGDNKESIGYSQKSLILFEFIDTEMRTYSLERINKIESIKKRIDQLSAN
jgi:hypothetical protein